MKTENMHSNVYQTAPRVIRLFSATLLPAFTFPTSVLNLKYLQSFTVTWFSGWVNHPHDARIKSIAVDRVSPGRAYKDPKGLLFISVFLLADNFPPHICLFSPWAAGCLDFVISVYSFYKRGIKYENVCITS